MATSSKIAQSYTMEEFISLGKGSNLTYDNYSYKDILSNGTEIAVLNVVNDYLPEIKDKAVKVKLSDDEYRKYRYKPKLLCYDVYGAPELYYVVLLINGMIDVKEFNSDTFYLITKDDMNSFMSEIYNAEYQYIAEYNTEHGTNN
jgi:hypothetical protein